jgi:hypothetical protein
MEALAAALEGHTGLGNFLLGALWRLPMLSFILKPPLKLWRGPQPLTHCQCMDVGSVPVLSLYSYVPPSIPTRSPAAKYYLILKSQSKERWKRLETVEQEQDVKAFALACSGGGGQPPIR